FSGRATWYSDTTGQCGHSYSQSDMIVAVNQDQMGTGKALCGKKILLTLKGSDVQAVVTVVDMCPGQYCKFGDLDLSQAAFKKFAGLGVGELQLRWSF
ncbi:RlpA-like double-psi beta-barrel-protein domain-containing protein-containing protein, partial [Gamsiella multidivaricata]|uniref:RlpA-like double-psi beta-barrel-protein domain-containing protein-containing protein n=1 Tax=Gamsiella multidivaricata TaxID=101098 RepID=UPI00221EBD25